MAGVAPVLQPAAHALLQARDDVARVVSGLTTERLWMRHGEAAPAGFHLRHLAGSLDRLLTYARGEVLNDTQRAYLAEERSEGATAQELTAQVLSAIDRALLQIRETPAEAVFDERVVGGRRLPSTVLGLLFHAAEHTTRHVGQLITTLRVSEASPVRV